MLDIEVIRSEFPALQQKVYGKPLIYFDNAATTLKPRCVVEELKRFYYEENSNIHRGTHFLSQIATEKYENARKRIAQYINAKHSYEVIFVRGATEGINLIASSFAKKFLKPTDEIIISVVEHHSNIVPWQMVCEQYGAKLKVIPLNEDFSLNIDELKRSINEKTKLLSITHVSNVLGIKNDIKEITKIAHNNNVTVVIDGAQGIVHNKIDVQDIDCDFYCFSGHKIYGPMGVGVVYGKEALLEAMPPYQGGGEMIKEVTFEKTTYNELPFKFEAGTPNVASVIALVKSIEFLENYGLEVLFNYEKELTDYAQKKLKEIEGINIYAENQEKNGVISFNIENIHHYDVGVLLDKMGIAVRTGHHCAQPLMDYLKIPGTIRVSLAFYNKNGEIDELCEAIKKIKNIIR